MRLARVLFMVALVGVFAVAARADGTAPVDPLAHFDSPDPDCTAPYCTEVTYLGSTTSSMVELFFSSVPPLSMGGVPANPPAFSCTFMDDGTTDPCVTDEIGNTFFGFDLFLPLGATNGQTFSITVVGAPLTLTLPSTVCEGNSTDCSGGGNITVDPAPEPGTALLFMSGFVLLFLAGVARKRFATDSVA
jgi:hypothetical protein